MTMYTLTVFEKDGEKLLDETFEAASEQDAIATLILQELESEIRWDSAFAQSSDALAKLAANAMAEYHAGKTQKLDPETL